MCLNQMDVLDIRIDERKRKNGGKVIQGLVRIGGVKVKGGGEIAELSLLGAEGDFTRFEFLEPFPILVVKTGLFARRLQRLSINPNRMDLR